MKDLSQTGRTRREMNRFVWITVPLLLAGSLISVIYFDQTIADWFHDNAPSLSHSPHYDAFKQFGRLAVPLWLCFLWAVLSHRRFMALQAIAAGLIGSIGVVVFKVSIQRLRPSYDLGSRELEEIGDWEFGQFCFPSGDTTSAFALALVFSRYFPRPWRGLPLLIAALIGMLRVVRTHHFLGDVCAGAALGLFSAWLAFRLLRRKWFEPLHEWWLQRPALLPAIIIAFPLFNLLIRGREGTFAQFFHLFGPWLVIALILLKGEAVLRWAKRTTPALPDRAKRRQRIALILLLSLAALATIPHLGWLTLWDRDEGYYAGCALDIINRGHILVPHFSGRPWLEKPPLTFWGMAISMLYFGLNEAAVRLPSALAGIAAMAMTGYLGRRLYSPATGLLAAVILGTALLFTGAMRLALLDSTLVCTVLLSMLGLEWFLCEGRRPGLNLFYLGCGLGVLAKGPLGLVLPIMALAGFILLRRAWSIIPRMKPLRGLVIICVVVGAWALPAIASTDGAYFLELVWVRTIEPIFSPLQGHGGGNILEYLALLPAYIPVILVGVFPWSFFLPTAVWKVARQSRREDRAALLTGWAGVQLIAFSLVSTKLPHYMLPLFPALAIMTGHYLSTALETRRLPGTFTSRRTRWALTGASLITGAVLVALPAILGFRSGGLYFLPTAAALVITAWWAPRLLASGHLRKSILVLTAGSLAIWSLLIQLSLPRLDEAKSAWQVAEYLEDAIGREGIRRTSFARRKYNEVSLAFYLRQDVIELNSTEQMQAFLSQDKPAMVAIPHEKLLKAEKQGLSVPYRIQWSKRVWIPEKGEWMQLCLIRNREWR